MEAIDRWRESLPEGAQAEAATAAAVIGGGLLVGVLTLARRRRGFFAWAIPGAILGLGVVLLTDVLLDTRGERMVEAEERISEELASLDPIARAQVLKAVGERQMNAVFGD
ncbi:MAG: hypothetical protein ACYC2X_06535 [Coriobacteriia bacterium]